MSPEKRLYFFAQIDCYNEDIAPFPELLDQEWKVSKLNEHTAQSPLLTEEPSGFYNQQKIRDSFSFIVLTIENIYI